MSPKQPLLTQLFLTLLLILLSAACSGKPEPVSTPANAVSSSTVSFGLVSTPTTEAAADSSDTVPVTEPEPTTEDALLVTNLNDVRKATVRITFAGSYLDYAEGDILNFPNHGSGFIIDPSGIAVTNNHVVTGASFLEIQIDGEERPRNARILGVSECSDLAVIDIDGDGFPYLDWYDGPISVGQTVYAAGFPVYGNTEYTLTRGIIAKETADGESSWASVSAVLQIDAAIQGGNSGGPLVTENGRVVAINYAGISETHEGFSISREAAMPVIAQLRLGQDVHSLGINGQALTDFSTYAGVWVASVASGSPADRAGIRAGDLVTSLEGLLLASDGTMADYCDILRTHNPDDTLSVEVWRVPTGEILAGRINDGELETVGYMDDGSETEVVETAVSAPPTTTDIAAITDDSGILTVDVPARWANTRSELVTTDYRVLQVSLWAAADIDSFPGDWSQPGLYYAADFTIPGSKELLQQHLDAAAAALPDQCEPQPPGEYGTLNFPYGLVQVFLNCSGETDVQVFIGTSNSRSFVVTMMVPMIDRADIEALNPIFASMGIDDTAVQSVTDNLPGNSGSAADHDLLTAAYGTLLSGSSTSYAATETAVDDAEILEFVVPAEWQIWESDYREGENGRFTYASLQASPHSIDYTFDQAPGITISADTDTTTDVNTVLDDMQVLLDDCTYQGRQQLANYLVDVWTACGDLGAMRLNLAIQHADGITLRLRTTLFSRADLKAVDAALRILRLQNPGKFTMVDVANGRSAQTRTITITDSSSVNRQPATFQVTLPAQWIPLHAPWWKQGTTDTIGSLVSATTDQGGLSQLAASGVFIGSSETYAQQYTPEAFLDVTDLSGLCAKNNGRSAISIGVLSGKMDTWTG